MNFLGHLFFSDNNPELMYANLYGDFFKGKNPGKHDALVQSGIKLHRSIDHYIDHHPEVLKLMHELYDELPKVTGIAIDLYFDHLLAKNWNNFHPLAYQEFLNLFYNYKPKLWDQDEYPSKFRIFIEQLKMHRWMDYYPTLEGLKKACQGISTRISFENKLPVAPEIFIREEEKITRCFNLFMADAIPYFKLQIKNLDL